MAVLQAYFDESGKQSDHPLIAVGCVFGPSRKIEKFNDDWTALLRQYDLSDFHMVRAREFFRTWGNVPKQTIEERIELIKPFADCIGENLELGLIQAWDVKGFKAIPDAFKAKIGNIRDPYYLAFVRALLELIDYLQDGDVLSLICDYDIETAWDCYRHYQGVRKAHEEVRKKTVSISFANDKFFPALQAADMVASLTRHEARDQFYKIRNDWLPLFNYMVRDRGAGKIKWLKMFADEQRATGSLRPSIRGK
jgi:hypothetical protein